MEKRQIKKLVLTKETVKELTDPDLANAAGGIGTNYCTWPPTGCENTGIVCEYSERGCCNPLSI